MTDLRKIIQIKDYNAFAGPDWPSYQQILDGKTVGNASIQSEVSEFVSMMTQTYNDITIDGNILAEQNQQRQDQIFFDKQLHSIDHCQTPWNTLGVNNNGDIFICSSPSWIPKFVGNILEVQTIFDALNSSMAQKIRQEILAGRYFYCNNRICGFFNKIPLDTYQTLPLDTQPLPSLTSHDLLIDQIPKNLIFDFDYTCNFQCPSCRTELINNNKHHIIRPINNDIVAKIKHLIIDQIKDQSVEIRWCGGEPFISEVYLDLLTYITHLDKTNIRHVIQTNGSYLRKKSDLLEKMLPSMTELRVSFDAATPDTYHKIRVHGQWEVLLENVRWARSLIDSRGTGTLLSADFVVQADNYKEIPEYVKLCNGLGIDKITFQKMWNWGTWPKDIFKEKNVYNPDHPEYANLLAVFKQAHIPIDF